MELIKHISKMRNYINRTRKEKSIGFIPTMGGLHEGHLSLIRKGRKDSDVLVVSIFANPTQFGPEEDFESYPRDLNRDIKLVEAEGADVIFAPSVKEIYPDGYSTFVEVEEYLTSTLEGDSRPGHFRGVTTILTKLFNIISPDRTYLGEKDYQQVLVVKKLVNELNLDNQIIVLPIVRENDGLAISSRNSYFNEKEREAATILYKSLKKAQEWTIEGEKDPARIIRKMKELIEKEPLAEIDYITIVGPSSMEKVQSIEGEVLIILAVKIGKVRLIDNMRVKTSMCQS